MLSYELRGCLEWRNSSLQMNTSCDQACKLFDSALTQIIKWSDDPHFDGLESTLTNMVQCDTNFVLGHVLKNGIQLIGNSNCASLADEINDLEKLTSSLKDSLTIRELYHVDAVISLFQGELLEACKKWERILVDCPTDLMAIKFLQDSYFYLGYSAQMKDSIARILPYWNLSTPLYSYLLGMYSFGLVQSNYFDEAHKTATKALELNKTDAWAVHTVAHYYEYKNDYNAGIKFMKETESNWSPANYLMGHNYWHLALYNVENNDHQEALNIFDHISNKTETLDMVDLSSLLFRLKLDSTEHDLKEKWSLLKEKFEDRIEHHGYVFNDAHVLMILSACDDNQLKETFFSSLKKYLTEDPNACFLKTLNKTLANNIFNSIIHFDRGEFSCVVDLLYPHKYDLIKIGGSNAQRDLFHQMLTISALRSDNDFHKKIGLNLINERLSLKPNSSLTKRIAKRFIVSHSYE